jgi:methyltransferase (TIGR00027 family)
METERPDAIFRDPFARRLAGERGEAIVNTLKSARSLAWAMIVRTAVFDEIILDCVTNRGVDLVLNLAAGLDARAWRLPLPATLRWIDVDLPEILQYKVDTMRDEKPTCRYETVQTDLTNPEARDALFSRLGREAQRVLVVTEGLLVYLKPEQVSALARDLHKQPGFHWWLIDLASSRLLQYINRSWGKELQSGNAPFLFGPAEGTDFFKPLGWREIVYRSSGEEAQRLHREMKFMWLWRFLGRFYGKKRREEFRRFSGIVLLERDDA